VQTTFVPGARLTFPLSVFEAKGMGIDRAGYALEVEKDGCYELEYNANFYSVAGASGSVYIFDGTNQLGYIPWSTTPLLPRTVTEEWSGNVPLTAGTKLTLVVEGATPTDVRLYGGAISAKLVADSECGII